MTRPNCGARTVRVADDALADTQRAIIEAAERRGYERAKAEVVVVDDAMRVYAERYRWLREHFRFANDSMRELWFDPVLEPNDSGVPDDLDQEIDRAMSGANA